MALNNFRNVEIPCSQINANKMSIPTQIEDKQKNSISYETYSYNTRQLQPQQ